MRKIYWFDIALITAILLFATTTTLLIIDRVNPKCADPVLMWDEGPDVVTKQ